MNLKRKNTSIIGESTVRAPNREISMEEPIKTGFLPKWSERMEEKKAPSMTPKDSRVWENWTRGFLVQTMSHL